MQILFKGTETKHVWCSVFIAQVKIQKLIFACIILQKINLATYICVSAASAYGKVANTYP